MVTSIVSFLCTLFFALAYCYIPEVQTKYGTVSGSIDYNRTHWIWYGIPYAQPPVDNLRWQLPQPPLPWSGVKQTTAFGAACPQPGVNGTNEDCLFLNVNTPISWVPSSPSLPVMIWIHGGSFWGGSGAVKPEFVAGDDMVFVSINYRLGALGFFALPELVNATEEHNSGFYGIQDQRMAFWWVQQNIAAFGGDPKRVTIAGQSAGAMSVCIHVASARSAGLFQQALMESGSCNQFNTQQQGFQLSQQVVTKLGCNGTTTLSCLYKKTYAEVVAASSGPIWPSFSAYEIQEQPIDLIRAGTYNKVPLLAGTNHDEQSFEACPWFGGINITQYNKTLEDIYYNPTYLAVAKEYPGTSYHPPVAGIIAAWSASRFQHPTLDMVTAMSMSQSQPIYMYEFNHIPSWQKDTCLNVTHSTELGFLFITSLSWMPPTEVHLAFTMREWWSSFVRSGSPISPTANVTWDKFVAAERNYMAINVDPPCQMQNDFLGAYAAFWDNLTTVPSATPLFTPSSGKKAIIA